MIFTCWEPGRVGNQLFNYAFIRAIQERVGKKRVYFSRRLFERRAKSWDSAESLFDYYDLPRDRVAVLDGRLVAFFVLAYRKCMRLFFKQDTGLTREQFFKRVKAGYIVSSDEVCPFDDISQLPLVAGFNHIEGYFQWPSLFLSLRDELRSEITLKKPLSESAQSILREIKSRESVCLHVRRGDYLAYDFYDICGYPYYRKAMEYVAGKVEDPFFYVFSDDIDWVEANYEIPYPHRLVKEHQAGPFDLELMRNCKHFIIPNSTFGWWAQFLTENEAAVVVAPRPWFGDLRPCSVYLPHWHIIDPFAAARAENSAE